MLAIARSREANPSADAINLGPDLQFRGVRMAHARNEEIFGEGETAEYFYRVVSGAVREMRFSSDGRRQILAFHFPGDIFGLETASKHGLTAEAICDTEVVMVRRSILEKMARNSAEASRTWLNHVADGLSQAREHAVLLGRKGANERVAAFLLSMSKRCIGANSFDLPMSRTDIADYLGLTIETVSRSFTDMERQKAIELPTSRHVVIGNRSTLSLLQAA